MAPSLTKGGRLYQIGDECYAVAMSLDVEVSERHAGSFWIGVTGPESMEVVFVDDQGGRTSSFTLTKSCESVEVVVVLDGTPSYVVPIQTHGRVIRRGWPVMVDWGQMYDNVT